MAIKRLGSKTPAQELPVTPPTQKPKGPPPVPGTGPWLLHQIHNHRITPKELTPDQRRACVAIMMDGTWSTQDLANTFQVDRKTMAKDMATIREQVGQEIRGLSVEALVGDLVLTAERCSKKAFEMEDPSLAWTVKKDLVRLLRELGFAGGGAQDGLKITIEAMGAGYDRAREMLDKAMDPRLTGEIVAQARPSKPIPKGLPLKAHRPDAPDMDPDVTIQLPLSSEEDQEDD